MATFLPFLLVLTLAAPPSPPTTAKDIRPPSPPTTAKDTQPPSPPTTAKDTPLRALIHFGDVDPLAFIVATFATFISLLAFWLTWQETRRNNRPIVKVRACEGKESLSRFDGWQPFPEFTIVLSNRGISLWDVEVWLEVLGEEHGSFAYQFRRTSKDERLFGGHFIGVSPSPSPLPLQNNHPTEFARGMITEYQISSKHLYPNVSPEMFIDSFSGIKDIRKQRARITVHSQGYEVYSIPISGAVDRLKGRWNRFAYSINGRFDKVIPKRVLTPGNSDQAMLDNVPWRIQGKILPTFLTLEDKLFFFLWRVRQQKQQPQQPIASTETNE